LNPLPLGTSLPQGLSRTVMGLLFLYLSHLRDDLYSRLRSSKVWFGSSRTNVTQTCDWLATMGCQEQNGSNEVSVAEREAHQAKQQTTKRSSKCRMTNTKCVLECFGNRKTQNSAATDTPQIGSANTWPSGLVRGVLSWLH
jgi:hypothetical protein